MGWGDGHGSHSVVAMGIVLPEPCGNGHGSPRVVLSMEDNSGRPASILYTSHRMFRAVTVTAGAECIIVAREKIECIAQFS